MKDFVDARAAGFVQGAVLNLIVYAVVKRRHLVGWLERLAGWVGELFDCVDNSEKYRDER